MKCVVQTFHHKCSGDPVVEIYLERENKDPITVQITSRSKYDTHRMQVMPSCAVNPPWLQYFAGVDRIYYDGWHERDSRVKQFKGDIFRALDIRNERFDKQATWKEYREIVSFLRIALTKLDRMKGKDK